MTNGQPSNRGSLSFFFDSLSFSVFNIISFTLFREWQWTSSSFEVEELRG